MSAEARLQESVTKQIRAAVAPLEATVDELSLRLAALEDRQAPVAAQEPKRASTARTAKTVKAGTAAAGAEASGPGK